MKNNFILNKFFSRKMIDNLLTNSNSKMFDTVIKRYVQNPEGKQYGQLISEVYSFVGKEYRNEYYYKNTMLNKLLFKRHNYKTTTVITELPVAKSKADFVMINGKGIVYEIKTELDNLDRIHCQINDYYKAFTEVIIVTYLENIEKLCDILPEYVGIMELTKRGALKSFRNPVKYSDKLQHEVIFKVLRKSEYEYIIKDSGFELPDVNQFLYYKECLELIKKMDIDDLQLKMMKQLKARKNIETVEFSLEFAKEIRLLLYVNQKAYKKKEQLEKILEKNYREGAG